MSADSNIRTVRDAYAAFTRGDLPAVLSAFDDGIQWITPGNFDFAGERNGKEEVTGFLRAIRERWDFLAFEPADYIASGDRVVALGRYEVRSRQTGKMAASHWAMVWTFRDGKAVRFQEYTDTSALEGAEAA